MADESPLERMALDTTIPIETPSTANLREHWSARAKRADRQRKAASLALVKLARQLRPLLVVRLTRVSPRALDSDNLASALKSVRDGVADRLRVDDGSPLVRWEYAQSKGPHAVVVTVEEA